MGFVLPAGAPVSALCDRPQKEQQKQKADVEQKAKAESNSPDAVRNLVDDILKQEDKPPTPPPPSQPALGDQNSSAGAPAGVAGLEPAEATAGAAQAAALTVQTGLAEIHVPAPPKAM